MEYLETCFSRKPTHHEAKNVPAQKRDMLLLLLPWIAFCVTVLSVAVIMNSDVRFLLPVANEIFLY
jgi:hypothetical protein